MIDKQLIESKQKSNRYWSGIRLIGIGYLILALALLYYIFNPIVFDYLRISIIHYGYPLLIFHLFASSFAICGLIKCFKEYKKQNKKQLYLVLPVLMNLPLHGIAISSAATFLNSLPL